MVRLLRRGDAARVVGETRLNLKSSRSHSVFTVTVQRIINTTNGAGAADSAGDDLVVVDDGDSSVAPPLSKVVVSRMHLVDLSAPQPVRTGAAALRAQT